MAVPLDEFRRRLIESELLTGEELDRFEQSLPADRKPRDAADLAAELHRAGRLTRFQAATLYQGRHGHLVLGEYVILERLGAGGMGEVFKARHRAMDRVVALKVLPAKRVRSPEAVERFRREVRAAARLTHPNIVIAYDAGEAKGVHFLVTEYVDGQDLARVVAEHGPLPVEEAVGCIIQAAQGLQYAHQQGVVHRDIKPSNLLLSREGVVKVLDLGLARLAQAPGTITEAGERLTSSGHVMGTVDYIAPEQAQDTHAADHRADIYSLGCTLYRLLTGHPPYRGESAMQVLLAHVQAPVPSLREALPEVPAALDEVCRQMMAKRPEDRQQSMSEVNVALEQALVCERASTGSWRPSTDFALRQFFHSLEQRREPVPPPVPPSHMPRETASFQQLQDTAMHGVPAAPPVATAAPTRTIPRQRPAARRQSLLGLVALLVAMLLVVGMIVLLALRPRPVPPPGEQEAESARHDVRLPVAPAQPTKARIRIIWPQQERAEGRLEIDSRPINLVEHTPEDLPDHLVVEVPPGRHTIWAARRKYEPIERQVAVAAGEQLLIQLDWKPVPEVPVAGRSPAGETAPTSETTGTQGASQLGSGNKSGSATPGATQANSMENAASQRAPGTGSFHTALDAAWEKLNGLLADWQTADRQWCQAVDPVAELVVRWQFERALRMAQQIAFTDQQLATRLEAYRQHLAAFAQLKRRLIERIGQADPPLEKRELGIRGLGGQVVSADEQGVTCRLLSGKSETLSWDRLGPRAAGRLLQVVVDPTNGQDLLAAGLMALALGDTAAGRQFLSQAAKQGVDTGPHADELAQASFRQVVEKLQAKEYATAGSLLEHLEKGPGIEQWVAANGSLLDAVRAVIAAAEREQQAEQLYQQAVAFYRQQQLFDVREAVSKLRQNYADTTAVLDSDRDLSLSTLAEATAKLGRRVTVRQDGKGDYTNIQAAIDAVPPYSLIEIEDNGPYNEKVIFENKVGLTLRAARGYWPVITSSGPRGPFTRLVSVVHSRETTLERLVLLHTSAKKDATEDPTCVACGGSTSATIRSCVLYGDAARYTRASLHNTTIEQCIVVVYSLNSYGPNSSVLLRDTVLSTPLIRLGNGTFMCHNVIITNLKSLTGPGEFRSCTFDRPIHATRQGLRLFDSIFPAIEADVPGTVIEHCLVYGANPFTNLARPGKGCLTGNPQFLNPKLFDYRLAPTSPARGRASDGGDIGCRITPEMAQMIQLALELRARGAIKF